MLIFKTFLRRKWLFKYHRQVRLLYFYRLGVDFLAYFILIFKKLLRTLGSPVFVKAKRHILHVFTIFLHLGYR